VARVIVVGAGVVGLTCAVRLLEAGHRVDVLARDLPLETTSTIAAALWYPYLAHPREQVLAWAATSYDVFRDLAHDEAAGVRMLPGHDRAGAHEPDPWWGGAVPDLRREPGGWTFTSPVIEMPVFLGWLVARIEELGGTLTRMNLSALPSGADVVVNASGLGARLLGDDHAVTPVRGQVVHVEQVGLEEWWLDATTDLTYVIPRERIVVVGGTEEPGEWSRTPDPATAEAILARATALVPALAQARVLGYRVGLRPARTAVRLERVGDVVHCYGHGGAGVTLAWGTAADVVAQMD